MSSSAYDIVFGTLFPILANITAVCLFLASLPNVYKIRQTRELGAIDGNIYCILLLSCIGWCAYGIQQSSITIGPLNLFGCMVMYYCSITYYTHIPNHTVQKRNYEYLLYACMYIPVCISFIWTYACTDYSTQSSVAGSFAVAGYIIFLSSPLVTIRTILNTKNTSVLSIPLTVVNFVNCCLWTLWSLVYDHDYFVYVPNGIGIVINIIFLVLIVLYRNSTNIAELQHKHSVSETGIVGDSNIGPVSAVELIHTPSSKNNDIPYSTMIDIESNDNKLERQDSIGSTYSSDSINDIKSISGTPIDGLQLRTTPKSTARHAVVT